MARIFRRKYIIPVLAVFLCVIVYMLSSNNTFRDFPGDKRSNNNPSLSASDVTAGIGEPFCMFNLSASGSSSNVLSEHWPLQSNITAPDIYPPFAHGFTMIPRGLLGSPSLLPCNWTPKTFWTPFRFQGYLQCNGPFSNICFKTVKSDVTPSVTTVSFNDVPCLKIVIRNHCTDIEQSIPRIAHYIRFDPYRLTLDGFFSILSLVRFVKPCLVLYHSDVIPSGPYWRALLHLVPNIVHVQVTKPTSIFGHRIHVVEHSSDVLRIQLLEAYGGVYLDPDYLVLHSLDNLLNSSMVMGIEEANWSLCNGFMMSKAGSEFLQKWLANYTDFDDSQWEMHSTLRPYRLSLDYPHLIRLEDKFFKPNYFEIAPYFHRWKVPVYDWSEHWGLHLYTRKVRSNVYNKIRLDKQNNVIGDMVRHILYGNQHACL